MDKLKYYNFFHLKYIFIFKYLHILFYILIYSTLSLEFNLEYQFLKIKYYKNINYIYFIF